MVIKTTSLMLDTDDVQKAKKLGINISEEVRKFIKVLIREIENPIEIEITKELEEEINLFLNDIKTSDIFAETWRTLIYGRTKFIYNKIGIKITPKQFEKEIIKRLEE